MAYEPKTKKTTASVDAYLKKVAGGAERLDDCKTLVKIMQKATGEKPAMWGTAIVGFGEYPIPYADGRSLDWPIAAFSPRKPAIVVYGLKAAPKYATLIKKLGKHKVGGGCLYLKSLAGVDVKVLDELISTSVKAWKAKTE